MPISSPLRVLVVDDTAVYRKIVADVIAGISGAEVVGSAHNGRAALMKIASLRPDLVTLDIEMPDMNGIDVLQELKQKHTDVGVIMLSSLTHEGGEMTMRALELGAFDFVPKPQGRSMAENTAAVKNALAPMLAAFRRQRQIARRLARGKNSAPFVRAQKRPAAAGRLAAVRPTMKRSSSAIVAIGISTGGPNALARMMPQLPAKMGVPLLIVQHMPPVFTASLAKSLNAKCAIRVKEAENGEPLLPDTAYIAPGGRQMKVAASADGIRRMIRVTDDPPENSCRPSADYLFRSVAHHYVGRATGVIMTGMGADGLLGLKLMKRNGAVVIAQDAASCVVYGMPKGPVECGIVDVVAPLGRIAAEIVKTVKPSFPKSGDRMQSVG